MKFYNLTLLSYAKITDCSLISTYTSKNGLQKHDAQLPLVVYWWFWRVNRICICSVDDNDCNRDIDDETFTLNNVEDHA
jgi:hypothetical protein